MSTWKDIKIATLQKMQSADGNDYPTDSSASDYLAAMPQACNEALQLLSTANKFITKSIQISQLAVTNLISDDTALKIHTVENEVSFEAEKAQSYYFECYGKGTATIYAGEVAQTVEIDSKKSYTAYKGILENTENEKVRIVFASQYPFAVKNVALYKTMFETEEDVIPYAKEIKYHLPTLAEDFYMIDGCEVYYEGSDTYERYIYSLEAGNTLVLDRGKPGTYIVYYKAYPVQITGETEDDYELPLASEVAALLPLYMASQIYKDDDIGIATTYRNEFEVARELLQNPVSNTEYEHVESESGWI